MSTTIIAIVAIVVTSVITWSIAKSREEEKTIMYEAAQIRQFICMAKQVSHWQIHEPRRFMKSLVEQFVDDAIHFSPQSFITIKDCQLKEIAKAMMPNYYFMDNWGDSTVAIPLVEKTEEELKAIMVEEFMKIIM